MERKSSGGEKGAGVEGRGETDRQTDRDREGDRDRDLGWGWRLGWNERVGREGDGQWGGVERECERVNDARWQRGRNGGHHRNREVTDAMPPVASAEQRSGARLQARQV